MELPIEMEKRDFVNISVGIIVITAAVLLIMFLTRGPIMTEISSFDECVAAGYPVMESFPRQCSAGGKTFVEELGGEDYYGSSTNGPCSVNSDCIVSGCNSEICQAVGEEMIMSICMEPDKPLPSDLGFECKCVESACKWG